MSSDSFSISVDSSPVISYLTVKCMSESRKLATSMYPTTPDQVCTVLFVHNVSLQTAVWHILVQSIAILLTSDTRRRLEFTVE